MRRWLVLVVALALPGCVSNPYGGLPGGILTPLPYWMHGVKPISNSVCPVDGREIDRSVPPSAFHADWVGFCSPACRTKFDVAQLRYEAESTGSAEAAVEDPPAPIRAREG